MYVGGISFCINKSFGRLQLMPEAKGLRFYYIPIIDGRDAPDTPGYLDLLLPLEAIGGLWATAKAFLSQTESLDENVLLKAGEEYGENDILIKLYRDKPKGAQGQITGEENCWLRLVTGRAEEERRRIKLGPRDLICFDLSCQATLTLSMTSGSHVPQLDKSLVAEIA